MERELNIFKALSDKNRLRVMMALARHKELCACQITEMLGVTGATASRHMGLLLATGMVCSRKDGRWVFYRLTEEGKVNPLLLWAQKSLGENIDLAQDEITLEDILAQNPEDLCRKQRGKACCP